MRSHAFAVLLGCTSLMLTEADLLPCRASEVHVDQARGRLPAGAASIGASKTEKKPREKKAPNALIGAPEGAAVTSSGTGSPTTPATCNQQNASSPACYSATQQARPVGR